MPEVINKRFEFELSENVTIWIMASLCVVDMFMCDYGAFHASPRTYLKICIQGHYDSNNTEAWMQLAVLSCKPAERAKSLRTLDIYRHK